MLVMNDSKEEKKQYDGYMYPEQLEKDYSNAMAILLLLFFLKKETLLIKQEKEFSLNDWLYTKIDLYNSKIHTFLSKQNTALLKLQKLAVTVRKSIDVTLDILTKEYRASFVKKYNEVYKEKMMALYNKLIVKDQVSLVRLFDKSSVKDQIKGDGLYFFTKNVGAINHTILKTIGVEQYIWKTKRDYKVRPRHRVRESRIYPLNSSLKPGQEPFCRCLAVPVKQSMVDVISNNAIKKQRSIWKDIDNEYK